MVLKIIFAIILLGIIVYFGISYYIADRVTAGYPKKITTPPTVVSNTYHIVQFPATDGITLRGWYFPGTSNKVVILVHGVTQNRLNEGYGGVAIAKDLLSQGYGVLMYDSRAHGESDGNRVGFGAVGGRDIIGAVNFIQSKGITPSHIGILADSNGAISLLSVLSQLTSVGAIISDSAAAHYKPVIQHVLTDQQHVPAIFDPGALLITALVFNTNFAAINPIDIVKQNPTRRILFLHGENDETIPVADAYALKAAANPQSELVVFPNAHHVQTYKTNPTLYKEKVFGFLQEELH